MSASWLSDLSTYTILLFVFSSQSGCLAAPPARARTGRDTTDILHSYDLPVPAGTTGKLSSSMVDGDERAITKLTPNNPLFTLSRRSRTSNDAEGGKYWKRDPGSRLSRLSRCSVVCSLQTSFLEAPKWISSKRQEASETPWQILEERWRFWERETHGGLFWPWNNTCKFSRPKTARMARGGQKRRK